MVATAMSSRYTNSAETDAENRPDTTVTDALTNTSMKQSAAFSVTKSIDGQPSPRSALQNAWKYVAHTTESSWRRLRRGKRRGSRYAIRGALSMNFNIRRKSSARSSTATTISSSMPHISVYMHPELYREHNGRRLMDLNKVAASVQSEGDEQTDMNAADGPDRRNSNGKTYPTLNRSLRSSFANERASELHHRHQMHDNTNSRRRLSSVLLFENDDSAKASAGLLEGWPKRRSSTNERAVGVPIDNIVVRRRDQARIL